MACLDDASVLDIVAGQNDDNTNGKKSKCCNCCSSSNGNKRNEAWYMNNSLTADSA